MTTHRDRTQASRDAAQVLGHELDLTETTSLLTSYAHRMIANADGATVSMFSRRQPPRTAGSTDARVDAADRFQHELVEGPCFRASCDHPVVHVRDLSTDPRWPRWGPPVAQQLGYRSVLSARLDVGRVRFGALTLYSTRTDAFTAQEVEDVEIFAAHAAVSLEAVRRVEQLETALTTRTTIAQAEGIIMERYGLTAPQAFDLLTRLSQHRNEKLRAVAAQVVAHGVLPHDPQGDVAARRPRSRVSPSCLSNPGSPSLSTVADAGRSRR